MKDLLFIFVLLVLVSCGKAGKNGSNGVDGSIIAGVQAVATGIDFEEIAPGLACSSGGVSIFTFFDNNSNGLYDSQVNPSSK